MVHRRDINKQFSKKDKEKLLDSMSAVHFPNREAVLNEIDVLKHV
jgi:hypothetical protein